MLPEYIYPQASAEEQASSDQGHVRAFQRFICIFLRFVHLRCTKQSTGTGSRTTIVALKMVRSVLTVHEWCTIRINTSMPDMPDAIEILLVTIGFKIPALAAGMKYLRSSCYYMQCYRL